MAVNDHALAGALAQQAGHRLTELRTQALDSGVSAWELGADADRMSHELLIEELLSHRPDDAILSEEGADDPTRLTSARTWIIDPLDGTQDYPYRDNAEWAVHVALVEAGRPTAAAVSVPGMGRLFGTELSPMSVRSERAAPLVVSSRAGTYLGGEVARHLGGRLTACGSAGVKAMLVVGGDADVYVHSSGLWEWDVCAPAAVASAAGMTVADLEGAEIEYNKEHPVVRGLVVCRPEFVETVGEALGW
ncbi:MAG: inositol monophosphatase family protein [Acidimicrobiales bacterium]